MIQNSDELVIVSGGDDQQISILKLKIDKEGKIMDVKTFKGYGHSSSIKGIAVYEEGEKLKVASSSYDQRFKTWVIDQS